MSGLPNGFSNGASGQLAVTSAAQQLGGETPVLASEVILTAAKANTGSVYVGFSDAVSDSTGLEIPPGVSITLHPSSVQALWAVAAGSETLSWAALY